MAVISGAGKHWEKCGCSDTQSSFLNTLVEKQATFTPAFNQHMNEMHSLMAVLITHIPGKQKSSGTLHLGSASHGVGKHGGERGYGGIQVSLSTTLAENGPHLHKLCAIAQTKCTNCILYNISPHNSRILLDKRFHLRGGGGGGVYMWVWRHQNMFI